MRWLGMIATTLAVLIAVCAGVPCVLLGLLGISGYLADISEHENQIAGMKFLGLAVLAFVPLVIAWRNYRVN